LNRGIIRERTKAGLAAARARGKIGGRPPALSDADLAAAKALLRDPNIPVEEAASASAYLFDVVSSSPRRAQRIDRGWFSRQSLNHLTW